MTGRSLVPVGVLSALTCAACHSQFSLQSVALPGESFVNQLSRVVRAAPEKRHPGATMPVVVHNLQ